MKIVNRRIIEYKDQSRTAMYDFDDLSTIQDFVSILDRIEKKGYVIDTVGAHELGDLDNPGKKMSFDFEDIDKLKSAFAGRFVEKYYFGAHNDDHELYGTVVPSVNRLLIEYTANQRLEIERMLNELGDEPIVDQKTTGSNQK